MMGFMRNDWMKNRPLPFIEMNLEFLNKMEEETITISKKEYDQLIKDSDFLACLMQTGVDNWDGFEDAQTMYDQLS